MSNLLYVYEDRVAKVTWQRPAVRHALDRATLRALLAALEDATQAGARALILTGTGDLAFSAGADLKELATLSGEEMLAFCQLGLQVAATLEAAPFLTIAAINGSALGGGLEMALACDLRYAVATAQLGLPEIKLGLIPGWGGIQRLSRTVGFGIAQQMLLRGALLSAQEAQGIGLIHGIMPADQLLTHCCAVAQESANYARGAVSALKSALQAYGTAPPAILYARDAELCARALETPSTQAALYQFLHHKDVL